MSDNKFFTPAEIMRQIEAMDNISEQQRIDLKVRTFYKFIKWTNEDYKELVIGRQIHSLYGMHRDEFKKGIFKEKIAYEA